MQWTMQFWTVLATIGGVAGLLVLLGGLVVRGWVTPYLKQTLSDTRYAQKQLHGIADEFDANEGSSAKDAFNRIEHALNEVDRRLLSVEAKQHLIFDLVRNNVGSRN